MTGRGPGWPPGARTLASLWAACLVLILSAGGAHSASTQNNHGTTRAQGSDSNAATAVGRGTAHPTVRDQAPAGNSTDARALKDKIRRASDARSEGRSKAQQLLGTQHTPRGRYITDHAAERMATPPRGRVPMTPAEVDTVIDQGRFFKRQAHPQGDTITYRLDAMQGRPKVSVDAATQSRVTNVIRNRK